MTFLGTLSSKLGLRTVGGDGPFTGHRLVPHPSDKRFD